MNIAKRLQRLESFSQLGDSPSEEDYRAAQERRRHRMWLWNADIVRTFGGEIPAHCQPLIAAAESALAGDTEAQHQWDEEVSQAWSDAHGISDATDYRELLCQRLRQIALRMKPGSNPDTMAGAVAQVLFRKEYLQEGEV